LKLEISGPAEKHLATIDAWWRANRSSAPELFLAEASAAFDAVLAAPLTGRMIAVRGAPGTRRIVLRTTRYHVYYRVERDIVTIVAIWSAVRGRGPSPAELRGTRPRRRKR
jgi:plasmid stabilization system protein ParE